METQAATQRQSRVGKAPIALPKGVEFSADATSVKIKGPKGTLTRKLPPLVNIKKDGEQLIVGLVPNAGLEGPKFQGLTRALVANMVKGVSAGYAMSLDLHGVGYRAELKGRELTLSQQRAARPDRRAHPLVPPAGALQGQGRALHRREDSYEGWQGRREGWQVMLAKEEGRERRKRSIRAKISGSPERPRQS